MLCDFYDSEIIENKKHKMSRNFHDFQNLFRHPEKFSIPIPGISDFSKKKNTDSNLRSQDRNPEKNPPKPALMSDIKKDRTKKGKIVL